MASELLRTGMVTVVGEDYPEQVVDLGRHEDLTVTLTGGNRWGESGVSPMSSIRTWSADVASKSGAGARHVVMDPAAALRLTALATRTVDASFCSTSPCWNVTLANHLDKSLTSDTGTVIVRPWYPVMGLPSCSQS